MVLEPVELPEPEQRERDQHDHQGGVPEQPARAEQEQGHRHKRMAALGREWSGAATMWPMPQSIDELVALLDLETLEDGLYRGKQAATSLQRVFGGQVA